MSLEQRAVLFKTIRHAAGTGLLAGCVLAGEVA